MSFFVHETCDIYLSLLYSWKQHVYVVQIWTRNIKIYKRIPSTSHQITLKFSQGLFRVQTRTRSPRHCWGSRPRRLTKVRQPSSQCPTGADRYHRSVDSVPTSDWCECTRDPREVPDRSCFSSLRGSNPRSTSYARIPNRERTCQDQWKFHFCNYCIIVLWPGWHRSGALLLRGRLYLV